MTLMIPYDEPQATTILTLKCIFFKKARISCYIVIVNKNILTYYE